MGCTLRSCLSACRGGRGCTLRSCLSASREGRGCSQHSCLSASREGRGCSPRTCFSASRADTGYITCSCTSPCRGGKDCTPHNDSSPSRASTVSVLPSLTIGSFVTRREHCTVLRAPRRDEKQRRGKSLLFEKKLELKSPESENRKQALFYPPPRRPRSSLGGVACEARGFGTTVAHTTMSSKIGKRQVRLRRHRRD